MGGAWVGCVMDDDGVQMRFFRDRLQMRFFRDGLQMR
jgi:hypothetical protein